MKRDLSPRYQPGSLLNALAGVPMVTLAPLNDDPYGHAAIQAVFNVATDFCSDTFGHPPTGNEGRGFFSSLHLDSAEHIQVFAIVLHQQVSRCVGFTSLGWGYSVVDEAFIHYLCLAPNVRKQGIAQQTVARLEELSRPHASNCSVRVPTHNQQAQKFWARMGYAPIAEASACKLPPKMIHAIRAVDPTASIGSEQCMV